MSVYEIQFQFLIFFMYIYVFTSCVYIFHILTLNMCICVIYADFAFALRQNHLGKLDLTKGFNQQFYLVSHEPLKPKHR